MEGAMFFQSLLWTFYTLHLVRKLGRISLVYGLVVQSYTVPKPTKCMYGSLPHYNMVLVFQHDELI